MNIELGSNVKIKQGERNQTVKNESTITKPVDSQENLTTTAETKQAIDEATGVLQTIVSEKLSDKVLRKMPPDEYLKLLSLVDNMFSGSVDKKI